MAYIQDVSCRFLILTNLVVPFSRRLSMKKKSVYAPAADVPPAAEDRTGNDGVAMTDSVQKDAPSPGLVYSYSYLRRQSTMGYRTEIRDGKLYHCLDHDIMMTLLKYQGEKNVKITMYLTDVPSHHEFSDPEMPRHQNDFLELTYVVQGHVSVIVDQKKMSFRENELYLINPNVSYQEIKKESDGIVFNISLKASFFNEMLFSNIPEHSSKGFLRKCLMEEKNSEQMLRFSPTITSEQKKISDIYSLILEEYKAKQTGYMVVIQGYFIRLLDYLVTNYQFSFSKDVRNQYREYLFQEVKRYMYIHYQDIRLSDLSSVFHYQENYFNRLIREFTGKSYSVYLIHVRMKTARDLLEYTDESIEEIMEMAGYHNKGFFYRAFTEEYGVTPAVYRKQLQTREHAGRKRDA